GWQLRSARAAIRERPAGGAARGRQRAQAQPGLQRFAPGETIVRGRRPSVLWVFAAGQDCSSIYGSRAPLGFRGVNYSGGLVGAQAEPRSFAGVCQIGSAQIRARTRKFRARKYNLKVIKLIGYT